MEIAFVSANKIHIEIEKKQEGFLAIILTRLTAKPSKFIATMLIGNNIALVFYGFFMGDLLVKWFQSLLPSSSNAINYLLLDLSLLTQTVLSTVIILLTAEFLPKVFFQIYSNRLIKVLALPAYLFYLLFSIVSEFVIWISDLLLKYFFKIIYKYLNLKICFKDIYVLQLKIFVINFREAQKFFLVETTFYKVVLK